MKLTITGYSTALFATWYFIEELGLLFDAGDGVSAHLLQKSRKIKHIFISHPDRDHITGLLQIRQLNAREGGFPWVYYPKDAGSFPAMDNFMSKFDAHTQHNIWHPLNDTQDVPIKKGILVHSIRNEHIEAPKNSIKSLSFDVIEVKQKLKEQFKTLSPKELQTLRLQKGNDFITEEKKQSILSYSGDTPVQDFDRWKHSKILIHEATFLDNSINPPKGQKKNQHSTLEEVIEMVAASKVEQLILGHFSSRYSKQQIQQAVMSFAQKYALNIPIFCVFPGEVVKDILNTNSIV
ncbi:MBL fold metallo-hydrolase [Aureispira sp. CCB-QB1]|uniref:MBL fold metallo-hydrolase n=1 Tax=Aureispira sp. CCB-QB1 TaxID=1313421 RepID=UPI0006965AB2|nr:MBL fold metallo-hydrolase [Aureispira sp. CCB-QB1]